jgi:hypothetical protein
MSGVTGECLTFLLVIVSFSENACARALAFTLDVISQDDITHWRKLLGEDDHQVWGGCSRVQKYAHRGLT